MQAFNVSYTPTERQATKRTYNPTVFARKIPHKVKFPQEKISHHNPALPLMSNTYFIQTPK